jgi:hypothetical protein
MLLLESPNALFTDKFELLRLILLKEETGATTPGTGTTTKLAAARESCHDYTRLLLLLLLLPG